MLPFHWLTQTIAFGLGIAFSPINIALVALLMLGRQPLRRFATYLGGWVLANGGAPGTRAQVQLDLRGAGALLGLGRYLGWEGIEGLHQITVMALAQG